MEMMNNEPLTILEAARPPRVATPARRSGDETRDEPEDCAPWFDLLDSIRTRACVEARYVKRREWDLKVPDLSVQACRQPMRLTEGLDWQEEEVRRHEERTNAPRPRHVRDRVAKPRERVCRERCSCRCWPQELHPPSDPFWEFLVHTDSTTQYNTISSWKRNYIHFLEDTPQQKSLV